MSFMYTTRDYRSQEGHMLLKRVCLKWHIHWAAQSVRENCMCQAVNYTETHAVTHMHTQTCYTHVHTYIQDSEEQEECHQECLTTMDHCKQ